MISFLFIVSVCVITLFVYQAIDYISYSVFIIYAVELIYDIKLFMGELGVAEFGLCVMWCGEGRELWSGKGGAQRSVRLGRRAGRSRWEFVWATWTGQGKFFGEGELAGEGRVGVGMCGGEATQGQGPERGVWPHPPRQRTRVVLWSWVWRRRGLWEWGEQRSGADSNRVWGVEKEDQERPLHGGRTGTGRTCVVWEHGKEKEGESCGVVCGRKGARRELWRGVGRKLVCGVWSELE
jgi:hypothetical protein